MRSVDSRRSSNSNLSIRSPVLFSARSMISFSPGTSCTRRYHTSVLESWTFKHQALGASLVELAHKYSHIGLLGVQTSQSSDTTVCIQLNRRSYTPTGICANSTSDSAESTDRSLVGTVARLSHPRAGTGAVNRMLVSDPDTDIMDVFADISCYRRCVSKNMKEMMWHFWFNDSKPPIVCASAACRFCCLEAVTRGTTRQTDPSL